MAIEDFLHRFYLCVGQYDGNSHNFGNCLRFAHGSKAMFGCFNLICATVL